MKDQKSPQHRPESSAKTLVKSIQQLEDEKENLRLEKEKLRIELWKQKREPSRLAGYTLLLLGATALASSIVYESSILAFIGLGLIFWGALLSFIRPVRYVRSTLLDSTTVFSLMTVDQLIDDLHYTGKGIYLPPRHLKGLKEGTVFIPSKKDITTPSVEKAAEGIRLTPSGSGLVNLFEKELGTNFAKVDLNYLKNNLPKLFIEGLEIAEDFEMNIQSNTIHIRIIGSIYNDLCKEVRKLPNICNSIGCPLCSSIACALTRATGKPVVIESNQLSADGRVIEAYYRTLEAIPSMKLPSKEQTGVAPAEVSAPSKPTERHPSSLLPNLVGSVLAAFGLAILAWVGWLTWYDITTWGKSLALIFFGSRTGEAISLGIGMKVVYYFLIGLVLFLLGDLLMLFRKRRE